MSLIDQRILIVAPVEVVWSYVADPRQVSKWHQGCKQVSVLTTRATGVGTRRRCVDESGRATVEETTAWFENIGYEYVVVDGPYRDFRGRFRLQAIPEGTIVNWTVEYHLRGLFAGPRNLLTFRRHFEDLMAESLRALRKLLENSGVRLDPERHARYAMRDGPSAEWRASRMASSDATTRPGAKEPSASAALRPVSVGDDDVPEIPADLPPEPMPAKPVEIAGLAAPTVVRPQPALPEADAIPEAVPLPEPWIPLSEQPVEDLEDTKPRPPRGMREAQGTDRPEKAPIMPAASVDEPSDISRARSAPTVPISMVAPPYEPPPVQETQTMGITPPSTLPEVPSSEPPQKVMRLFEPERTVDDTPARSSGAEAEAAAPPQTTKEDTGEISIWDAFGLDRPSEKNQADLEAIIASLQPKPGAPGQNGHFVGRYGTCKRHKASPRVRGVTSRRPPRLKTRVRVRSVYR